MSDINKRKRSNNFTFAEKELLLKIALPRKSVLEDRTSNALTWRKKENSWEEIATLFNSMTPESPRNASCLRQKYDNIKKKMRTTNIQNFETVDCDRLNHLTEHESELIKNMQVSAVERIQFNESDSNDDSKVKLEINHNSMSYEEPTSKAILNLTEQKVNLMSMKMELAKQELKQSRELHQLKMKHLNEEHDLRMMVLQYECT